MEALRAATYNGGMAMGLGAGEIREGALADALLVEGDPTSDPAIVANRANLRMVMLGGKIMHGARLRQ